MEGIVHGKGRGHERRSSAVAGIPVASGRSSYLLSSSSRITCRYAHFCPFLGLGERVLRMSQALYLGRDLV